MMQQSQRKNSFYIDIIFLTIVLGGLFFILLGTRPLFVPDEGRYAEIAREMLMSGDYVTPYLNGIKYFEKPALFYWLGAAAMKLGGINLWSLRSINALLGLLGCVITYLTARKFYGRPTGLLAGLILGTSTLYFVMAHTISLDLPVTLFLTICLMTFILGTQEQPGLLRRSYLYAAATAAALAVLTKGLIGIVFPSVIIFAWIAALSDWRILKKLYLPSCIILFLIIALPWHIIVNQRNPEFFAFYFIEQHFLRYTTAEVGHYQPVWFFLPTLMLGLFPWSAFLIQSVYFHLTNLWHAKQKHKLELFFLLWASIVFVFFSFSKSKLIPYILPVFPPLAILIARYLTQDNKKGIRIGFIGLTILSSVIAFVIYQFVTNSPFLDPLAAKIYYYPAAATLFLGMLIACVFSFKNIKAALALTTVTACIFLLFAIAGAPAIDNRTILPLVKILETQLKPNEDVITYNRYYQDLPFYLQRRITIVTWVNELSFGMQHQDTHEWMLDDEEFWQRWHSPQKVYVFTTKAEFNELTKFNPNEKIYILGETIDYILMSNKTQN